MNIFFKKLVDPEVNVDALKRYGVYGLLAVTAIATSLFWRVDTSVMLGIFFGIALAYAEQKRPQKAGNLRAGDAIGNDDPPPPPLRCTHTEPHVVTVVLDEKSLWGIQANSTTVTLPVRCPDLPPQHPDG